MLEIVLTAALSQAAVQPQPRAPERQAQATVRIMRVDPIRLGQEPAQNGGSLLRSTELRESDGSVRPASLIEFY